MEYNRRLMEMKSKTVLLKGLNRGLAPSRSSNGITVKTSAELDRMLEAGRITGEVLSVLRDSISEGMTTYELDQIAEKEIRQRGGIPAFKGYRGFPATLCVSVNEEIVHGIPSGRVIENGDVIGLDLGAIVDGLYGDSAITVAVGNQSIETLDQIATGKAALFAGIEQVRSGNRIGDVSKAIEAEICRRGKFGIVREYVGHGIGRRLHEEPSVPNFGPSDRGPVLKPGMAIAIEPMINLGGDETRVLEDDWTVVTADGTVSVHFEHTIIVTENEPIITPKVD